MQIDVGQQRGNDSPYAIGNFEFEVGIRRRSASKVSTSSSRREGDVPGEAQPTAGRSKSLMATGSPQ